MKTKKRNENVERLERERERESGTLKNSKKRYNNYDLLRIISCIAVIVIHVTGKYKAALTDGNILLDTTHPLATIIWNTLSRFAVPCFVMISGAMLLSNDKNQEYKNFYCKSFKKTLLPSIIFCILFTIITIIDNIVNSTKGFNFSMILAPIKALIKGKPYYHLWFLYMIIGLYLLTPIIIRFKNSISKKSFSIISYILVLVTWAGGWTSTHDLQWDIGYVILFLGYFMIGYELKQRFENNQKLIKGILFILGGLLLEFILVIVEYKAVLNGTPAKMGTYSLVERFSPIIVISSILIFSGFSNIKIKKDLSKLSGLTFYIYIFHAVVLKYMMDILTSIGIVNKETNSNIVIILGIISVFSISYICSILWNKFWNLINKNDRIYNKIDKMFKI